MHLTPEPQAAPGLAVIVVGYRVVDKGDIRAHPKVKISDIGIFQIAVHIMHIDVVGMIDLDRITFCIFPPDAVMLLDVK